MKLLNRISFAAKTALLDTDPEDTLKAGKHSDAGLIHRLRQEIADLRSGHSPEVDGYKEALRKAAQDLWAVEQEAAKYKAWFGKADDGWRRADAEVKRLRVLLSADAGLPGTEPVLAPIEQGCRDTPASNADTQAVDVADLRAAMGEGDTQLLPVVPVVAIPPLDQLPVVTWGTTTCGEQALEKWATATSPRDAGPTEVSPITGHLASVKVQLATTSTD